MSCLFHSLSSFLRDVNEKDLRKNICDYLETNPQLMEDISLRDLLRFENMEHRDYIRSMRDEKTWGGAIEIKGFCELYKIAVDVRIRSTGKTILFTPDHHPCPSKIRIEWQGHHYIPLPY